MSIIDANTILWKYTNWLNMEIVMKPGKKKTELGKSWTFLPNFLVMSVLWGSWMVALRFLCLLVQFGRDWMADGWWLKVYSCFWESFCAFLHLERGTGKDLRRCYCGNTVRMHWSNIGYDIWGRAVISQCPTLVLCLAFNRMSTKSADTTHWRKDNELGSSLGDITCKK